jgi:hypothetical protein
LKEHKVVAQSTNQVHMLHLAGDVEGHYGRDGMYYLLDLARLFCPR